MITKLTKDTVQLIMGNKFSLFSKIDTLSHIIISAKNILKYPNQKI